MKKIAAIFLFCNFFFISAEEKENYELFETYFVSKPLLSRITGSEKGFRYIGCLSEEKDPKLSWEGKLHYAFMMLYCKLRLGGAAAGQGSFYVCSTDENLVQDTIKSRKKEFYNQMEHVGTRLKKSGKMEFLVLDEDTLKLVGISFVNLTGSDIDTKTLGAIALGKKAEGNYGVFSVKGNILKIVLLEQKDGLNNVDIFPTEEEIAQVRSGKLK